jgi:fibronectin type 3 domain-containing protein
VKTIRGSVLDNISSFELYRAEIPIEDFCGTCPIPFGEPMELAGGSPFDGKMRRKASYASSLLRAGYKYFFKVRSRTSWWADSADSNIITFVWFQPTAAPEGVTVTPGDRQVTLKWQPVTSFTDGSAVEMAMQYQVLRSLDGNNFERLGEPVATTDYVDRQVINGQKYFYTIQSMMVLKDDLVSGGISKDVGVTPLDLTPPLAPAGVTVVRTGVGIKIFWDKSAAADIGGYRVYRRAAAKDSYELLGEVASEYTLFVDSKADDSVRYYYAITAFDQATPPNESNKSKEGTVRY